MTDLLREMLVTRIVGLHDDELRVLLRIADRLALGQERYGILKLKTDHREWKKEAQEEALDLAVYLAMGMEVKP